jgi:hypothetical protein
MSENEPSALKYFDGKLVPEDIEEGVLFLAGLFTQAWESSPDRAQFVAFVNQSIIDKSPRFRFQLRDVLPDHLKFCVYDRPKPV